MLLRAGFTLLWNPFPTQPIRREDTITQDINDAIIGEAEEYEEDCEEINTAASANILSQDDGISKKVTISSLTTHNTTNSSNSSLISEATPSSPDLSLDYLQGYLFKSPITSTLLDTPIPGYYGQKKSDVSDEPPLIYYKRREDYYPPKSINVALEKTSTRVLPGTPKKSNTTGMPILKPSSRISPPKKALFKRFKKLVKKN